MIERDFTKLLTLPRVGLCGVKERAYLDCGCSAYFGIRFDNHEAIMAATACSTEHESLIRHFQLLYRESLVEPQVDRPAVEVADDLLSESVIHAA